MAGAFENAVQVKLPFGWRDAIKEAARAQGYPSAAELIRQGIRKMVPDVASPMPDGDEPDRD